MRRSSFEVFGEIGGGDTLEEDGLTDECGIGDIESFDEFEVD